MTDTWHTVQQLCTLDCYMNDLKTCIGDSSECLCLSIEKASKLTDNDPTDICVIITDGNLLKFLYSIQLHEFTWNSFKEKKTTDFSKVATTSHAGIIHINCKQHSNESLTSSIYRWGDLMLCSCEITVEQHQDKLKIDQFSWQLVNEKIARWVIRRHPKTIAHAFCIPKEGEKELLIDILFQRKHLTYSWNQLYNPNWCSVDSSNSYNTVEYIVHLQRPEP